jgi:hypothetical protein
MSMHLPKKIMYGVVGFWFIAASAVIFGLSSASKSYFDPQLTLSQSLMSMSFEADLTRQLSSYLFDSASDKGLIFHVVQENCYCEWLARPHQQKIDKWALENKFITHTVSLKTHPELKQFVPSTPAVIAMNQGGKIIYLGPYSRGSGCFAQTGEIDAQLSQWLSLSPTQKAQQNMRVDTDASGCYCEA